MGTYLALSNLGATPFEQLLGHNLAILDAWNRLELSLFTASGLDSHLLEQVRRTLAFGNQCEYCMVKAGRADTELADSRTSVAVAFAALFVADHTSITRQHFAILGQEFNDREISALCAFITFISASQRLCRICNLTEEYQLTKTTTMGVLQAGVR